METATYGSELIASRVTTDQIVEWRYNLRMLGVHIGDEPSYVFGDNQSVVNSVSIPAYNLKKRHNALCYHRVREAIAAGIIQYYHISADKNPTDVLTKFLPHSKWWPLMKPLLHWMTDGKPEDVNQAPRTKKSSKAQERVVGGVDY